MEAIITTEDLRKSFRGRKGTVEAVQGVSFEVGRGEIFGFLGPNGAGKTTTLRMLTTLLPIDSGTARVAGSDVGREPKQVRERIGYVSQAGGADDMSTGWENLILQGRLYGGDLDSVRQRAKQLAAVLDLTEFADRKVATFSGGQRRRLDVALGLIHQPEVLFLDEPTTGLDPQSRRQLWDIIRTFQRSGGTVLLTTHYMDEAERLCGRLAIVDHGQIIAEGSPADLIDRLGGHHVVEFSITEIANGHGTDHWRVLPGVEGVRDEDGIFSLTVREPHLTIPALLEAVSQKGGELLHLTTRQASLEDVFVNLTGRHLREE
jgi:ABC-2 type transport system ATP-binding protein